MTSEELYEDTVDLSGVSAIAGNLNGQTTTLTEMRASGNPLLVSFASDIDIQSMEVVSTNIGFIRRYQKRYKSGGEK
jgi:hypothetical protein